MPLYIEQSGDLVRCHGSLADKQTRKDRATQAPEKYKRSTCNAICHIFVRAARRPKLLGVLMTAGTVS